MSNPVRGPTSALTSFLREKGIHVPRSNGWPMSNLNRDNEHQNDQTENNDNQSLQQDALGQEEEGQYEQSIRIPIRRNRQTRSTRNNQDQNNVDTSSSNDNEDAEEQDVIDSSSTTAAASSRAATVAAILAKKKKKARPSSSTDEDFDGPFSANKVAPRHNYSKRRKPNYIDDQDNNDLYENSLDKYIRICTSCQRRFIVEHDAMELCPACINFPTSKTKRSKSKKLKNQLKSDINDEGTLKSLKSMCIRLIAQHIEDVEQFGDISTTMIVKISQIISRYRQLNSDTMKLFLNGAEDQVELFDCSIIDEDSLKMIGMICPNLWKLNLSYCGRITDQVINSFANSFTRLRSLKLGGCFLVTDKSFKSLFENIGDTLEELTLQEAAKVSQESMQVLSNKKKLKLLKLKRCHAIDEACLKMLSSFKHLSVLKLIEMNPKLRTDCLEQVFQDIGAQLSDLSLSGFETLSEQVLLNGIQHNCSNLIRLSLKQCSSLSNQTVVEFFSNLKTPGLKKLNLFGLVMLEDDAIIAAINSCGMYVQHLNLNGCDNMTGRAFRALIQPVGGAASTSSYLKESGCPYLEQLDVSWVRVFDDEFLKKVVDVSPSLKNIFIYGCNRLSRFALDREWKNRNGESIKFEGNEFD